MPTDRPFGAAIGVWLLGGAFLVLTRDHGGFPIPHGSGNLPAEGTRTAVTVFLVLGGLGLVGVGGALATHLQRVRGWLGRGEDRSWIAATSLLALGLSLAAVRWVYQHTLVMQDEEVYRFGAQILATGRLYAESPPDRLYYATNLVINDGKWYPQYFIGWPALLAPFMKLGVPGLANPVYFAATVPAVFLMLRRLLGSTGARVGSVLFATAPLAVLGAGSALSHTTTLGLLAWVAVVSFWAREAHTVRWSAVLAVLFCGAFFIRPTTALAIGGPFLVLWALDRARARDLRALLAFGAPALGLAAAFLAVNHTLTGSPTLVAYQRYLQYAAEIDYRFTSVRRAAVVANFRFEPWMVLATPFEALYRLNYASLGWPFTLVFVLPAVRLRGSGLYFAALGSMLGVHCLLHVTGVDLFGPVHFFEALLPLVVLVTAGLTVLWREGWTWAVGTALAAFLAAPLLYTPVRVQNLRTLVEQRQAVIRLADTVEQPAVILVEDHKFVPRCRGGRIRVRGNNAPINPLSLDAPVLWLNAIRPQRDRKFLSDRYPDRTGYRLVWSKACEPSLVRL